MPLFLRPSALIALVSFALFPCVAHAEKLRITSTPPGAKVEINGVAVGTTPLEIEYPGGYFHKTKTAVGSRLGHPLVARLSFEGYSIKEIVLTEGPAEWISLKGRNYGNYFLFKTTHFDVKLDSVPTTFTGGVSARLPAGSANLSPELSLEALAALTKPAVVQLQGLPALPSRSVPAICWRCCIASIRSQLPLHRLLRHHETQFRNLKRCWRNRNHPQRNLPWRREL